MSNERNSNDQSKDELSLKVQQLEQEILFLQDRLGKRNYSQISSSEHRQEGLIKNSWFISFGQFLLLDPDKNSIPNALARLGQLFSLRGCSLWRVNESGVKSPLNKMPGSECVSQWPIGISIALNEMDWLMNIWQSDAQVSNLLNEGTPLALFAEDPNLVEATEPLRAANIFSSLVVPFLRYGLLEGFVILHRADAEGWYARDIERLKFITNALFTMHDRQQVVRQLSVRDTRFNYAIEASNDGLWDWNIVTNKVYFSRGYLRMLGFQYEDLPGNLTVLKEYFLLPDDVQMVMDRYSQAIQNCETNVNIQFRMQHQSGKILWIQSKAKFCEPDENGRPTRCVGLNTDVSDFVHAHEELMSAKIQADMANKTKSEFLARMSHEIRTPMNAIIGLGYLLNDTKLDEQQKSYLTSLNSASDALLHTINGVLDFSKIESGKIFLEHSNFDLNQLFEKLSRLFEISSNNKKIRIIFDVKPDVPRFLRGDAVRLNQIIGHLIHNSLRYSHANEVIVGVSFLEAKDECVNVEFTVTDFGAGMSAERLASVNESLSNHIAIGDVEGSRFGLGICSHLIGLMNGSMTIKSEIKKGCAVTFTVWFDNSHLGSQILNSNKRELKNIRALVVDDNVVARMVLMGTAKSLCLVVDEADSGESALTKILSANEKGEPYQIVFMDYQMPNLNGFETATVIKEKAQLDFIPHIVLVSAYHRDEISKLENSILDVDEFMSKPVTEARLYEVVSHAIEKDERLQGLSAIKFELPDHDALLNNLNVLVAEDNVVNQQVVRGILKKKGIHVVIANNGNEALEIIRRSDISFDAILMDLEMPEMDGIAATKAIRNGAISSNVSIIALTAQAMRGDREVCLAAGMNAYLSKPINPEILYCTLAEQVANQLEKK